MTLDLGLVLDSVSARRNNFYLICNDINTFYSFLKKQKWYIIGFKSIGQE